jgi:hypothetical protein
MTDPDLKIAGFELEVQGRQNPDAADYWDGNWLLVTARCQGTGGQAEVSGALLLTADIERFRDECDSMRRGTAERAALNSVEPKLDLKLAPTERAGEMEVAVRLKPGEGSREQHRFEYRIERNFLTEIIRECSLILERYPVRGIPAH